MTLARSIFAVCALFMAASMSASESTDTISVKNTEVTIVETPTGISLSLKGSGDNPDYAYTYTADYSDKAAVTVKTENNISFDLPFMKCKNESSYKKGPSVNFATGFVYLGFAGGLDIPSGYGVDMGRSLDFGWLNVLALEFKTGRNAPVFSIGGGFGFRRLVDKNGRMYVMTPDKTIGSVEFPEDSHDRSSVLYGFDLHFPLCITQPLGGDWKILAGASLDVNTHSSISHRYMIGEEYHYYKWGDVPTRAIGYSVVGALSYDEVGIFCKWSPKGMVKEGFGPQTSTLSVGLVIGI